jgi:hypothetical protein
MMTRSPQATHRVTNVTRSASDRAKLEEIVAAVLANKLPLAQAVKLIAASSDATRDVLNLYDKDPALRQRIAHDYLNVKLWEASK